MMRCSASCSRCKLTGPPAPGAPHAHRTPTARTPHVHRALCIVQRMSPVCCRSPPPQQYDEAFLHKHARWQDALRAALAKADG